MRDRRGQPESARGGLDRDGRGGLVERGAIASAADDHVGVGVDGDPQEGVARRSPRRRGRTGREVRRHRGGDGIARQLLGKIRRSPPAPLRVDDLAVLERGEERLEVVQVAGEVRGEDDARPG